MTNIIRFIGSIQNRSLLLYLLFVLVVGTTSAQTSTRPTDGMTPLGIAAGAPAGSYALSGFDNVNLFNGNFNFALPLRGVGGRGSAGYTMTLAIERHWTVTHQTQIAGCFPSNNCWYSHTFYPTPAWWGGLDVGFGPGVLKGRKASDTQCNPGTPNSNGLYNKLTRLTFVMPGGTEYELIDKLTGGQIINNFNYTCYNYVQTPSRGTVFVTADGTAATFISDATIYDSNYYEEFYPSGYLMLRDGTRYRIINGLVDWMLDRNGNKLTFTYDAYKRVTSIKDSMDRLVTVSYANFTTTFYDQISFNGSGGTSRAIRIWYSLLGAILKAQNPSVTTPQTYAQLFPELNGASTSTTYNPYLVASVELPNGRTYQFKYNEYGEMARVVLPTGGAYEYDYAPGRSDTIPSGVVEVSSTNKLIYRRIVQKRVYKDGGSVPESRTTFGRPELYPNDYGPVQVDHLDSSGTTLLAREKHYFYNTALNSLITPKPAGYPYWTDGREYKTETFDGAGTTVLRRVEQTWEQRAPVSWWTYGASTAPPNDPRITQTLTTLEPAGANQVAKQTFTYDQYNNQTDSYEYDFGTSAPAANYTRRTHTDYLTTNPVNGAAYDTVNPNITNPDVSATIHIRSLPTRNQVFDASGVERARTTYEYDNYVADPPSNAHAALIARSGITGLCDGSPQNCPNQPNFNDPNYQRRGNFTGKTSFADAASQSGPVTSFTQYDVAGNPVASIDGLLRKTTFSYADAFCNGSTCGGTFIPNTYALVTSTTSPVPDPTGQYGATTPLVTSSVYDFWTGQVTSSTDANNQTTDAHYNDLLDRPTQVIRAVGTPLANQSTFSYDDAAGIVTTTADLNSYGDNILKSQTLYDGLGRVIETRKYETTSDYIATKQVPFMVLQDGSNWLRASQISNPFRPYLGQQPVWTTTFNDSLNRVIKVKTPDNAVVTTGYSGNTVTVTDQVGNKRKSVTDALGRLREVYEDPGQPPAQLNYQTSYAYDVLDNLVSVTQGTQQRFFMYDSLKRLIRARNPEQDVKTPQLDLNDPLTGNNQWCSAYQYDSNGNLTQKTDARGVISTYAYDAFNRNTTVRYTDGTKDIDRHYDGAINGKGRFWYSNWDANNNTRFDSHTVVDEYDAMGHPKNYRQHFFTNGIASSQFNLTRSYDLAGNVKTQTYPSGHTVSYSYDAAGRVSSYSGNLGDGVSRTYSTGVSYSEFGGLQQEQFGTQIPLYHKLHYNIRGQLYDTRLSSLSLTQDEWNWNRGALVNYFSANYSWGGSGTDNNGNITRQQHWVPTDDSLSNYWYSQNNYFYDTLNRLTLTNEIHGGPWGQSGEDFAQAYSYDRYGNRTIDQAGTTPNVPHPNYTVDPNTNRLIAPAGFNYSYDVVGNQTNDNYTGQGSRSYDGENRLKQAQGNGQLQTYTYDAEGRRIKRSVNGVETWQIYGLGGELLADYKSGAAPFLPTREYGYRGGQLLVTMSSGDDVRLSRFVYNLYYGALQRDPTSQELQDKVNQLAAAGVQSQSQLLTVAKQIARSLFISTAFETSPYRSDIQYVTDLYYTYLQRGPDDGGLGWWTSQVPGAGRENVLNAFEASSEFATIVSTLYGTAISDNQRTENFVNNFYLAAYSRFATSTELQQQRDALNAAAAQGVSQVQAQAESFGRSLFAAQVNDSGLSNTQYVTNLYEGFLQRGPDAGGLGWWSGQATVGQGRQNVLNAFAVCIPFRELAGTLYREAFWLVADHLGTPRMIVSKSGTLAGVKRHDYLPFGEELTGEIGGRTTALGYTGDTIRQQFTSKERDNETGLDYFLARYYSSTQGRFTSIDPQNYQARLDLSDPQSWNAYSYVNNNPLGRVDRDGRGFLTKLKNWLLWDVWGEEEDVKRVEEQKRAFLIQLQMESTNHELIVQSPITGQWVLLHPETMNRGNLWLWSNAISTSPGTRDLTPEEAGNVLDSALLVSPALKGDPYHPDSVAERQTTKWDPWKAQEARREASSLGAKLVKEFKEAGAGQAAGRSGGHGSPYARAGAELIRRAGNLRDNPALKEALLKEGKRLQDYARSVSHK